MNCRFEGCEKPVKNKTWGLCTSHNEQRRKGKPLTPIGSTYNPNNKRYDENSKCEYGPCDRKPKAKGFCETHYHQYRKGKVLQPIKEPGRPSEEMKYSETKTCPTCRETKNWKAFVMGLERPTDECRACYRKRLLSVEEEPKKPVESMDNLLTFIDRQIK